MVVLFILTIFSSAFLLFLVEPMISKMILPIFGGTPSVWIICMFFFQTVLLMGYAYAHFSIKYLGLRRQAILHLFLILLPVLLLPVSFSSDLSISQYQHPEYYLFKILTFYVGLPFFIISSTAPLLQRWFSITGHEHAADPYFLYGASNIGSFLALFSYPFIVERLFSLPKQSRIWSFGYYGLLLLLVVSLAMVRRHLWSFEATRQTDIETIVEMKPSIQDRLFWMFAAFVPSSLLLGVTTHITTDIAAIPLFWVIPLALYLLTFVFVFSKRQWIPHSIVSKVTPYLLITSVPFVLYGGTKFYILTVTFHLTMFFVVALMCHGELARRRPAAGNLTTFYLWMSLGGLIGGLFNAVISPLVFDRLLEYPIALILAAFLMPLPAGKVLKLSWNDLKIPVVLALASVFLIKSVIWAFDAGHIPHFSRSSFHHVALLILFALIGIICFGFKERKVRFGLTYSVLILSSLVLMQSSQGNSLFISRNFYGIKTIKSDPKTQSMYLWHGNILHGAQFADSKRRHLPLTYYHPTGPIGDVFNVLYESPQSLKIAVIGLGVGSIASYARREDHITFYEIDPVVQQIAADNRYFHFLGDCKGQVEIIIGDGRLNIEKEASAKFDVIIVDAFTSDAIPVHLLTKEAVEIYEDKLRKNGLIVFHISNRYVDLTPVLADIAAYLQSGCIMKYDYTMEDDATLKSPSKYIVLADSASNRYRAFFARGWEIVTEKSNTALWTDRYSNLVKLIKW